MIISLVAAMDRNGLIGAKNGLPWHLPAEFRHFKSVTMGKPIIMGRKTFESIGRPLPGRKNVVISRSGFSAEGVIIVDSFEKALAEVSDAEEAMVIGGASFFGLTINRADRMYLTYIDGEFEGDTWFPDFNPEDWTIIAEEHHAADEKNAYGFRTVEYQRKR